MLQRLRVVLDAVMERRSVEEICDLEPEDLAEEMQSCPYLQRENYNEDELSFLSKAVTMPISSLPEILKEMNIEVTEDEISEGEKLNFTLDEWTTMMNENVQDTFLSNSESPELPENISEERKRNLIQLFLMLLSVIGSFE